jgi:hypothetical protein
MTLEKDIEWFPLKRQRKPTYYIPSMFKGYIPPYDTLGIKTGWFYHF